MKYNASMMMGMCMCMCMRTLRYAPNAEPFSAPQA